jgi:hypothetical protein
MRSSDIQSAFYCFVKLWMQDTGCTMQDRKGSDPGYPVPGTWYLTPMPHSHIHGESWNVFV